MISRLSRSTMSGGVPLGAQTAFQELASKPGTNSASAGTSGRTSTRLAVVTASARKRPDLTWPSPCVITSNMTCTWPAIRSVMACGGLRYGTCTILVPVSDMNSSPARWIDVPLPVDAIASLPGLALRWAMNSGTVCTGSDGLTLSTLGVRRTPETGAKSVFRSN